jgi:DNA-binding transcriptional LysR family regulator
VISITWLPQLVGRLHARFPKVQIELEEALTLDLETKLDQGALDIILAPGVAQNSGRNAVPLGQVEFAWMASPALGIPGRRITPADLEHWPIIALSQESYHDASIEHWFQAGGARFARIGSCKSMGVAASLAMSGLGVTLLPVHCYKEALTTRRLIRIEADPGFPPIPFRAMCARPSLNRLAEKAAELAREASDFEGLPALA